MKHNPFKPEPLCTKCTLIAEYKLVQSFPDGRKENDYVCHDHLAYSYPSNIEVQTTFQGKPPSHVLTLAEYTDLKAEVVHPELLTIYKVESYYDHDNSFRLHLRDGDFHHTFDIIR